MDRLLRGELCHAQRVEELVVDDDPEYDGEYVSFSGVKAFPRPIQRPGPPVVMGGHSKPAWRRTVTHSEGWYGFMLDPEATSQNLAGLAEAKEKYEQTEVFI